MKRVDYRLHGMESQVFHIRLKLVGHVCALLPPEKREMQLKLAEPITVGEVVDKSGLRGLFTSILIEGRRVKENFILDRDREIILISPASGG